MKAVFIESLEFTESGKGEQEDLSAADKKLLKALANQYKRQAIRSAQTKEKP
jgi:hypothetical protein